MDKIIAVGCTLLIMGIMYLIYMSLIEVIQILIGNVDDLEEDDK